MNIPIYNCLIEETDQTTGIMAISFVDCPANEEDFVALARQPQEVTLRHDWKKQILTGVVLKPDQLIYRYSPQMGEYCIKFSADQIEKIAQKMMRTGVALHNTTHQHATPLKDNYLTELWIVEDPQSDKSNALGFKNLPKGTLMCSYKVEDKEYWTNEVLTGNVKGFSLEGFFNQQIEISEPINQSKQKCIKMDKPKKKPTLLKRIARMLLDIETVSKSDATASGEPYIIFVLSDGKEIYVDQDGFATLDEEQAPSGEHNLADGNILVIDEQGQFVETREASEKATKPDEATAAQTLRRAKHRLAELDDKTADSLKSKIAEMQATIDELSKALEEAQGMLKSTKGQVEEMRRKTPSVQPASQRLSFSRNSEPLTTAERMAVALNQTIDRKSR